MSDTSPVLMKLVRDGITARPGLEIRACSTDFVFRTMLLSKLVEEAKELIIANTRENFIEEMADVAEVMEALMDLLGMGISAEELRLAKDHKRIAKGAFKQRKLAVFGKVDL